MQITQVIKRPLVTEKSSKLQTKQDYVFEVDHRANKHQVKSAVEKMFKVTVTDVRVMNVPGKQKIMGRRKIQTPSWKKAVVTLSPGNKIEFFEGV